MTETTRVGIAELKAHLSEYIARARHGERIIVCDRGRPVAELTQTFGVREPLPITPSKKRWSEVANAIQPVTPRIEVDVVALLRESRDQR